MFLFLVEIVIADIEESNFELKVFDPLFRSQTFIVLLDDPETIFVLSGVIATELTEEEWPCRVFKRFPDARSQTFIVLSKDPETIFVPSDVTASRKDL